MSEIIIYQADDGQCELSVKLENEAIWLTQEQMVELFNRSKFTKPSNFYKLQVILA